MSQEHEPQSSPVEAPPIALQMRHIWDGEEPVSGELSETERLGLDISDTVFEAFDRAGMEDTGVGDREATFEKPAPHFLIPDEITFSREAADNGDNSTLDIFKIDFGHMGALSLLVDTEELPSVMDDTELEYVVGRFVIEFGVGDDFEVIEPDSEVDPERLEKFRATLEFARDFLRDATCTEAK